MKSIPFARVHSSLRAVVFACITGTASTALAADEVVTDCSSDAELRAELQAMQDTDGGILTFSCPPSTIVLTADLPVILKTTEIDGGGTITISGNDARRIFVSIAGLELRQLTLTNGFATGEGGAILSEGGVALDHVIVRDSVAGLAGGALSAFAASIRDSELDSNKALKGGAIIVHGALAIERSWIHDNEATGTDDGWGGGVYLPVDTAMALKDSIVSGNSAKKCGAGIYTASVVSVERSRIVDNACESGDGAGIHAENQVLAIEDSEISSNATPGGGGGLSHANGTVIAIEGSTLAENSSGDRGGAILITNTDAFACVNSTISSNDALSAGAMWIENTTTSLAALTIASNEGAGDGAVNCLADGEFAVAMGNLLLADNEEANLALAGSGGTQFASAGGNVSDDNSASATLTLVSDIRLATTLLGPLGLHGGLTRTHVPLPGSDALDAAVGGEDKDQRGFDRPQGLANDSGAVEVQPCSDPDQTVVCGDGTDDGTITSNDALKALRASVDAEQCEPWYCDYNGSGDVTSSDALQILSAAVGQSTSPECPPVWDCQPL